MFSHFNIDAMNETDVREVVVHPLLHLLGYQQGSEADIRTEVSLKYGRTFLGRKDSKRDSELRGRADYICDVIGYGRWIVEVKSPREHLSAEHANQAHTYAAHPEVGAICYLLTNGREFKIYKTTFLFMYFEPQHQGLVRASRRVGNSLLQSGLVDGMMLHMESVVTGLMSDADGCGSAMTLGTRPNAELIDRLAERLYARMEHLDPSSGLTWTDLNDHEREFYRTCVETIVVEIIDAARQRCGTQARP